ncbi:hypothetical protein SANTM175S_08977 [Streptomyces antimycoticus]
MLASPRSCAFAFILEMKDLVRSAVVSPVPKVSASAIAASQPDGSISAYSNWLTVSLSPVCRSAVLAPALVT